MDAFGRLIAIILAAILIFLFPLKYLTFNQENIIENHVHSETNSFTEEVINQGFISVNMYENYVKKINQSGLLYDIELVHSKPLEGYDEVSSNEILNNLYRVSTLEKPLTSGTFQLMATHTHTDACYNGTKHTHSAYDGSCYTYTVHYHTGTCYHTHSSVGGSCCTYTNHPYFVSHDHSSSCYTYQYCSGTVSRTYDRSYPAYCPICKRNVSVCIYNMFCDSCGISHGSIEYYYCHMSAPSSYTCNNILSSTLTCTKGTGTWYDNYSWDLTCGMSTSNPICGLSSHYELTCGKTEGAYYNENTEVNPICNQVVTSIMPTKTTQTVLLGSTIETTAIATYLDGHTGTVNCTNNYKEAEGTQEVVLTYTGLVGDAKTTGTRTTTTTITTLPNTKVCIHGHTYELDDYNSDLGCPICKETVSKITVAPLFITVNKGDELSITVMATYLDGHTQNITMGWTSNFDNSFLGNQLVTVSYEGKTAYVSVTVVADDIVCAICNNTYTLNADGSDPGCPICSKTVISISATPESQRVPIESGINLEVTATYKDGHSAIVTGWTSNFDSFKAGTQTVTVYYKNVTTIVTVIVESETETTCPICGTIYNSRQYVNGCPFCANTVNYIEARLRDGGNLVQLGSDINLAVILFFKDGHRELAYNNYIIEGYQPNVLGNQTITVKYNEQVTTLIVEVVNTLSKIVCSNGHVYYLNEDGTNSGCPICFSALNQDELVEDYFKCIYTEEILEKLYVDGIYTLDAGDFITINVKVKASKLLERLQNMFYAIDNPDKKYSYGGMILGPCI